MRIKLYTPVAHMFIFVGNRKCISSREGQGFQITQHLLDFMICSHAQGFKVLYRIRFVRLVSRNYPFRPSNNMDDLLWNMKLSDHYICAELLSTTLVTPVFVKIEATSTFLTKRDKAMGYSLTDWLLACLSTWWKSREQTVGISSIDVCKLFGITD